MHVHFGFPQIVLTLFLIASLGYDWWYDGTRRTVSFTGTVIGSMVILAIAIWGGFFS